MKSPFESIAECHPGLGESAREAIEYWEPEAVPLAVGLGALANALVRSERDFSDEVLARVAACVEEALETRGDARDAMAAGFLEAVSHRADESPTSVERIVRHFGPRAVEYLRAWDESTGAVTPGVHS